MIIIPGPFHAVSSPSTTYNVNNNVRTRYAAYIIYNILYPKPTRSLVYIKPSLKKHSSSNVAHVSEESDQRLKADPNDKPHTTALSTLTLDMG